MKTDLLKETNFKFAKKFGQNFIFDTNLLSAIVNDSNISKDDDVLEIGAGAGTLTKIIAANCNKVVSYEIDKSLEPILEKNLKGIKNSTVVYEDALKCNIETIESNFSKNYKIVANLPYYITTPLIFKFIEQTNKVTSITIMVQKEVAERLVATNSSKDYGTISVMLEFFGSAKIMRNVSRRMFIPAPNVDSAVVRIDLVENKFKTNKQLFSKVVSASFAMRRKTLVNNLSSAFGLEKSKVLNILQKLKLNPSVRGENLSCAQYVCLTNELLPIV